MHSTRLCVVIGIVFFCSIGWLPCAAAEKRGGNASPEPSTQPASKAPSAEKESASTEEPSEDLDIVPGEELLLFEDMPVVISASRTETKMNWLSVPTSIVTAEDIHYSGLTNIPEILRYVPGMDVEKLSRWRYSVGVRGMQDYDSDRMLVLIDGRDANDLITGGATFFPYPVLMEDIKRIEVVRGPGGAAWGANAFNGVLNIITKEPEDCLGYFATTTWSQFGDSYNQVRWAEKTDKLSWKLSAGYEDMKSSEDALHHATVSGGGPLGLPADSVARDYYRDWRFDGKFIYRLSDETKIKFGSAYSEASMGDFEWTGNYPTDNGRVEMSRSFARIETELDHRSDMHVQWYTNTNRSDFPSWCRYFTLENDLEAQYNLRLKKHKITAGGNVRWNRIDGEQGRVSQLTIEDEPLNEYWAGLFAIDRWEVTDRFALEGQLRGDYYSETRPDWSARVSALYALDKAKQHIVRLSGAKAFRTPSAMQTHGTLQTNPLPSPPFPPNTYSLNLVRPDGELENEETASVEVGYTGQLTKYLTFRTNAYFQRYDKLIGYNDPPQGAGAFTPVFLGPGNLGGANAWGVENELELKGKPGSLSAWYAYNDLWLDHGQPIRMAYAPAHHKVGITGRVFLPYGVTFNTNYRFSSARNEIAGRFSTLPISHHLDLTLSKKLFDDHGELMIGVSDVFRAEQAEVYYVGASTGHETPGRTFFVRFQMNF